jgi:hypothetical protein
MKEVLDKFLWLLCFLGGAITACAFKPEVVPQMEKLLAWGIVCTILCMISYAAGHCKCSK